MGFALVLFLGDVIDISIANMDGFVAYSHEWCPRLLEYYEIANIFRALFAKLQSIALVLYPSTY